MTVALTTAASLQIIPTAFLVILPAGFMSHGSFTDDWKLRPQEIPAPSLSMLPLGIGTIDS
jgi:hypothetical protein